MRFVLDDEGWKRIAEDFAPFFVSGGESLATACSRAFLQLRPRRHHETPRGGFSPARESEHSHDPVDRGGVLADECEFIDDSQKYGRGVSVNITIDYQEWEL